MEILIENRKQTMPPTKSSSELAKALSKTELLALLDEKWLWIHITHSDIVEAKLSVLQKKCDATFAEWLAFILPEEFKTVDDNINYYKAVSEKQKIYKKYERIQKRIDKYFDQLEEMRHN